MEPNINHSEQRSEAEENKAEAEKARDEGEKALRVALRIKTGIKAGQSSMAVVN
jgi:hypothetical protein